MNQYSSFPVRSPRFWTYSAGAAPAPAPEQAARAAKFRRWSSRHPPLGESAGCPHCHDRAHGRNPDAAQRADLRRLREVLPNVSIASKDPDRTRSTCAAFTTQGQSRRGGSTVSQRCRVLDDQSAQLPGRNLDIYAATSNASKCWRAARHLVRRRRTSGAVRYITTNETQHHRSRIQRQLFHHRHGDPQQRGGLSQCAADCGYIGAEGVIYEHPRRLYPQRAGTFSRSAAISASSIISAASCLPEARRYRIAGWLITPNIHDLPGSAIVGLAQFSDDWSLLLQQSYQRLEADGVYAYDPTLGDLNVQQYNASATGSIRGHGLDGEWQDRGVENGLYRRLLDRKVTQVTDYTAYARVFTPPIISATVLRWRHGKH